MDPDIGLTEEEIEEQRRKIGDPRRIYTRSDEQYPDARFRPSYVDPSMEKPVYAGMAGGGAEESEMSPLDFVPEAAAVGKMAAKGFPAIMGALRSKPGIKVMPSFAEDLAEKEAAQFEAIKNASDISELRYPDLVKLYNEAKSKAVDKNKFPTLSEYIKTKLLVK
jgi:hypothetical protein